MTQPLFSTLKRTENSFHSSVGHHTVQTWWEYQIMTIGEHKHLMTTEYVNGQAQWGGACYGTTDTQRILAEFGVQA